ncbi:MAG TPA: PAS domain S-box protein [Chitinophagaceae bacterium]|nr:PAS domain S-box protein [Chitinophagaceae bacterium]
MEKPLKILLLEDNPIDAEIIQRRLLKEKTNCEFFIATNKKIFLRGLEEFFPDVILSDNSLPQLNAIEALKLTRRQYPHIPFILVTGTVSDEYAADVIKAGADDYILKDRTTRLPAAINAALKQRAIKKEIADYKYALDESADVTITDQRGIIIYANENFCRISQYSAEELIGKDHRITNSGYHPASFIKNLWVTIARGRNWHGEFRNKAKDGSFYWEDTTVVPFLDQKGKPYQYLAIRADITKRKEAEEELLQSERKLKEAQAIAHISNWEVDLEQHTNTWSDEFYSIYGLTKGEVQPSPEFFLSFMHPDDASYAQKIVGDAFATSKDSSFEFRFIRKDGIIRHGRSEWRFEFNKTGKPVRLYGILQDITERKIAEQELQTAHNRLSFHIDNAPLGFIEWDEQIRPKTWSKRAEEIFGWTEEEIISGQVDWITKVYEGDQPWVSKISEQLVSGELEKNHLQHRNYTRDGRVIWCDWFNSVLKDENGKVISILSLVQDITERKKAEEEIIKSEEQYKDLVDNINDLICTHDLDGLVLSVNKAAEELIGHKFDPKENLNIKDILDPDKKNMFDVYITELKKKGHVQGLMKVKSFTGKSHIWEYKNSLKTTGTKTAIVRGYARDITESRKAEEELSRNELRFRTLTSNAPVGIFQTDAAGKTIYVNEMWMKITGLTFDRAMGDGWLEILHPDDKEKEIKQWLNRSKKGLESSSEFRLLDKKGNTRWVIGKATPLFNTNQQVTGYIGTLTDITERKKADELLKESNKRYEFVNKATQDTIWEWDYRTNKGRWGDGIMTTFGYSADKLNYGENWMDEYVHPDDKERVSKETRNCIKNNLQFCQHEYRFLCADGAYKYVFDRGYILYDENKKPYRMFGAMTDLTEKKRLERELAEQQMKQQKLITETIIQTQEKERNELGRELHDNINQILATVKMYLGLAKAKENVTVDLVGQSFEYVTEAMEEIRKLSHSLVAPSLDISLKEALEELAGNANLFNDLQVQLVFDEKYNEKDIDKNKELMFYRIVQEQMNNIIKYAKAGKVVITLKTDDDVLVLSVADDGVGFDVTQKSKGIGLKNISSRVEFYSGNMNIISSPGQGCTLEVFVPC